MLEMEYSAGKCKVCKSHRKIERKRVNDFLYILLTVVTGGLWLITWLTFGGWSCSKCGSKKVKAV